MKKKKLTLKAIEVRSFITSIEQNNQNELKGGTAIGTGGCPNCTTYSNLGHCTLDPQVAFCASLAVPCPTQNPCIKPTFQLSAVTDPEVCQNMCL